MPVEIHPAMEDAHDLDRIAIDPVEGEVRADRQLEVTGANVRSVAALHGARGKPVEPVHDQPHITIGLGLIPALGGVAPDARQIAAGSSGEADLHLLTGRLAHRGEKAVGIEFLEVAALFAFDQCRP